VKARILTTNIDLDEGTCSVELVESVADYFGLSLPVVREFNRMGSAFEHNDLEKACAM
jgi:serine/threonine-protein kinase HipA